MNDNEEIKETENEIREIGLVLAMVNDHKIAIGACKRSHIRKLLESHRKNLEDILDVIR